MNQDTNNPHAHDGHDGHNHEGHNHDGHNHADHNYNHATETPVAETATPVASATPTASSPTPESAPADNAKLFAIAGYVLPFLFFLPLVQDETKHNASARFHANQQLILLILWIILKVVAGPVLYMMLYSSSYMIMSITLLVLVGFSILGIMNVVNGKMKQLPLIGGFKLVDILFK